MIIEDQGIAVHEKDTLTPGILGREGINITKDFIPGFNCKGFTFICTTEGTGIGRTACCDLEQKAICFLGRTY
jgi:hypothetical protein